MPQVEARTHTPFSLEVSEAMAMRRQVIHPTDRHYVPETSEEVEKATRLGDKLTRLMQDEDFFSVIGTFMGMADAFVISGEITEEQYLSIHEIYQRLPFERGQANQT